MTLAITKDLLSSVFDDSVSYLPDSLRCEGIVFQEKDLSGGELFVVTAKVPSDTLVESALSKGATLVLAPETFRELNSGDSLSVIYCEDPRNASEKICLAYYSLVQTPLYGVVGGARDRELLAQFLAHLLPGRGQTIDQLGENLLLETISAISRLHDQFD
ncbi:MAG: hypothetical protein KDD64_12660, partial [Bdellovibrionales bacterium]|nr:hypothetical protein [Bdellovibrionales bacterium]